MRQQTSGVKQTKKQESSSCFQTFLHPEAFSSSRPFKAQEDVNCQGSLGIYCTVRQERRSKETTHGIHLMQRGWTVHVSCLGGSVCCFIFCIFIDFPDGADRFCSVWLIAEKMQVCTCISQRKKWEFVNTSTCQHIFTITLLFWVLYGGKSNKMFGISFVDCHAEQEQQKAAQILSAF